MIPDHFTPLIGYRGWDVTDDGLLTAVNNSTIWPPRERMSAACIVGGMWAWWASTERSPHIQKGEYVPIPAFHCTCGMHAYRTLEALTNALGRQTSDKPLIYGQVQLWGRVIEHQLGYRAQYAYPGPELYLYGGSSKLRDQIERLYGVKVKESQIQREQTDYARMQAQMGRARYFSSSYVNPLPPPNPFLVLGQIIQTPPKPAVSLPHIFKPTRYQLQQYAGGKVPHVIQVDWRMILREMIYKNAKAQNASPGGSVKITAMGTPINLTAGRRGGKSISQATNRFWRNGQRP